VFRNVREAKLLRFCFKGANVRFLAFNYIVMLLVLWLDAVVSLVTL
jgi:hypothetical protein